MAKKKKPVKLTVSELKRRLSIGTILTIVEFHGIGVSKKRIVIGTAKGYAKLGGDGIRDGEYSMLIWPKASELTETADGFILTYTNAALKRKTIRYIWGEVVSAT